MRQSVVQIEIDDIGPKFDLVFRWPASEGTYFRATQAQQVSIRRFYSLPTNELKSDEATALLDYRDYAKAAVSVLASDLNVEQTFFIERCVAAYIGSDATCAKEVSQWAGRRYSGAADPETVTSGIKRSKPFAKVAQFFSDLTKDIEGADPGFLPVQNIR